MAGRYHTGRRTIRSLSRSLPGVLDAHREQSADLRQAVYVRSRGPGWAVVKDRCNDQEFVVSDSTGRTFRPGSVVLLGSHVGTPGETIIAGAVAGFGGSSAYTVSVPRRATGPTRAPAPVPDPGAHAIGLRWSGGVLTAWWLDTDYSLMATAASATLACPGGEETREMRGTVVKYDGGPDVAWISQADERVLVWNLWTNVVTEIDDTTSLQLDAVTGTPASRYGPLWVNGEWVWGVSGYAAGSADWECYVRGSSSGEIVALTGLAAKMFPVFTDGGILFFGGATPAHYTYGGVEVPGLDLGGTYEGDSRNFLLAPASAGYWVSWFAVNATSPSRTQALKASYDEANVLSYAVEVTDLSADSGAGMSAPEARGTDPELIPVVYFFPHDTTKIRRATWNAGLMTWGNVDLVVPTIDGVLPHMIHVL